MAIAATYTTVGPFSNSSTVLYTAPTAYQRDLVVTNVGPGTVSIASATTGTYSIGVKVPPGQSLVLSGPTESLWGLTSASTITTSVAVGQASVFSVI